MRDNMNVTIVPVGPIGTNCYLLESEGNHCAVIDPGAQPDKIIEMIEQKQLAPRLLLLTHGHHDHIGGVNRLLDRYPDMRAYIGEKDQPLLADADKSYASKRYQSTDEYIIENAVSLRDGEELALEELTIKVMDTPGHTAGGVSYLCRDALFGGDTLFYRNIGRCDLYGGDYEVMKETLRKLYHLEGDYVVYPGHGQTTTLEYERKNNHYMAEAHR